jgi:hypothetical protein
MNYAHPLLMAVAAISMLLTGAGAYRLLSAIARRIDPALPVIERGMSALEKMAGVAQSVADTQKVLLDMREGIEQIRIAMACIFKEIDQTKARKLPCEDPTSGMCLYRREQNET